jgi:hypothetical protein
LAKVLGLAKVVGLANLLYALSMKYFVRFPEHTSGIALMEVGTRCSSRDDFLICLLSLSFFSKELLLRWKIDVSFVAKFHKHLSLLLNIKYRLRGV